MSTPLPVLGFMTMAGATAVYASALFIGSAIYDIRKSKMMREKRLHPHARKFRKKPLVSIIIVTQPSTTTESLQEMLASVAACSYRKREVIIVNSGSKLANDFAQKHAVVIVKRKAITLEKAFLSGLNKAKGEIIMRLPVGACLMPDSLENAVTCIQQQPDLQAITGPLQPVSKSGVLGSVRSLREGFVQRAAKLRDVLGRKSTGQMDFTIFRAGSSQSEVSAGRYAADVVAVTRKVRFSRPRGSWLLSVVLAVTVGYVWYVALVLKVVEPLGLLWLCFTFFIMLHVLNDLSLRRRQRFMLLSIMPSLFVLGSLYSLGQVLRPLAVITRIRVRVSLAP